MATVIVSFFDPPLAEAPKETQTFVSQDDENNWEFSERISVYANSIGCRTMMVVSATDLADLYETGEPVLWDIDS